jgi:lysophospholipase L1-like esterase
LINVWSAFSAANISANTRDGVHPNTAGSQLMADVWYAGIVAQGLP